MAKSKKEKPPTSFEDALSTLDTVVETLEGEAVPLSQLVDSYEQGMQLLESCHKQLTDAKQRVEKVNETYRSLINNSQDDDETELPAEDVTDELF